MMQTTALHKAGEIIQVFPRIVPEEEHGHLVLSTSEQAELAECEGIIARGLQSFVEVGRAMMRLRDKRLYRAMYGTFEEYCRARWQYGKSYAYHLIAAAEVASHLSTIVDIPKPTREAQVRPLVGLRSDQAVRVWRKAAESADGKPITARLVRDSAADFLPPKLKSRKGKPKRGRKATVAQDGREILSLIEETEALVREKENGVLVLAKLNQIRKHVTAMLRDSAGVRI
ncbi:MAG: hypothetical protein HY735_31220 [Verrucomicrobia bacterium]|nr:hypothetical protein [Verrucomicrobiota bacterium]